MAEEKVKKDETKTPEPVAETKKESLKSKAERQAAEAKQKAEFNAATSIHVKVYSPFQTYYDDDAKSISAENLTGPFDILPRHHNFITLLVPCELDIRAEKGDKKIAINRGVMHVHRNAVTVFLDV